MARDIASYREHLRAETADIHAKADKTFAALDLTTRQDLSIFMMTIYAVMDHLNQIIKRDGLASDPTVSLVPELVDDLRGDLRALGHPDADIGWRAGVQGSLDPLAIGYVVQGSRLGTAMMAKHWAKSTDPRVQQAGRYMSSRIDTNDWRALQGDLADIPLDSERAKKISADVQTLFEMHLSAYEAARVKADPSSAVA
ncbi:MAG: hypothetical protein KI792_09510 [Alphaproteobacteria bacterium]|nr:hypothetical protein [Alphaproteobacteria bacterium SS10]